MNLEVKDLPAKLKVITPKLLKSVPALFTLILIALYAFFALQITQYVKSEPTEEAKLEAKTSAKEVIIDDTAIESIRSLESRGINVNSNFDPNNVRNPFAE